MIVPDNKDWTWVLDRPCPECGSVLLQRPKSIRCWNCAAEFDLEFNPTKPGDAEAEAAARAARSAARAARAAKKSSAKKSSAKKSSARKKSAARRSPATKKNGASAAAKADELEAPAEG